MSYRLKVIEYNGKKVPICLQNENGPCPLLAISNVLLLRGAISVHTDYSFIDTEKLMELIGDYLLQHNPKLSDEGLRINYEKNRSDAIATFPHLQEGLDVNIKFRDISSFEFTRECTVFDLLNINLYHGWLVDPHDYETFSVMKDLSYNHVVEKIVAYQTLSLSNLDLNNQTSDLSLSEQEIEIRSQGKILSKFMSETASQLTYYGLVQLYAKVKENELCVFFRNNHFNTLTKHDGHLYLLVTDLGYLSVPQVVWERLDQIDGDTQYCDGDFGIYKAEGDLPREPDHPADSELGVSDHDVAVALHYELNREGESHGTRVMNPVIVPVKRVTEPRRDKVNEKPFVQRQPNRVEQRDRNKDDDEKCILL